MDHATEVNSNNNNNNAVDTTVPITVRRRRTSSNSQEDDENREGYDAWRGRRGQLERVGPFQLVLESMLIFFFFCLAIFAFWIRIPSWHVALFHTPPAPPVLRDLHRDAFYFMLQERAMYTLVLFQSPWCPEPLAWNKVAPELTRTFSPRLQAIQVDCSQQPGLCRDQTVFACSTIRLYGTGKGDLPVVHETDPTQQTESGLIRFVRRRVRPRPAPARWGWWWSSLSSWTEADSWVPTGPWPGPYRKSVLPVLNPSNFGSILDRQGTAFVVFIRDAAPSQWWIRIWEDQDYFQERDGVAARVFLVDCSLAHDWEHCRRHCSKTSKVTHTLRWYQGGELQIPDYKTNFLLSAGRLPTKEQVPELPLLGEDDLEEFLTHKKHAMILFLDTSSPDAREGMASAMRRAAKRLRDVPIAQVVLENPQQQQLLRQKQRIRTLPTVGWYDNGQRQDEYDLHKGFSEEALTLFARERLSHASLTNLVPKLNATTLDRVVLENRFVVVELCNWWASQWCYSPVWDKVLETLEGDGVKVFSVDCNDNRNEGCMNDDLHKYHSTLQWFRDGKRVAVYAYDYQKPLTVEALTAFTRQKFELARALVDIISPQAN